MRIGHSSFRLEPGAARASSQPTVAPGQTYWDQDIMEYLPLELCRAIANHLDAADRYQLVQVCRNFYALFLPSLYQDVVLCGDSKTTTFRFSLRGHDSLVLRRLELVAHQIDSKPFLACYIRHLRICHHSTTPHEFLPASGVNVLRAILQRLEGLTKMTFLMVPLMHTDLHFISSAMPNGLQHLIVEQCSLTFDRDESFELPGVQECSIYGPLSPEILSHQSSWAHIVTLDLSRDMPTMLGRILHPHPPHEPSFCLPRLRHLNVWHLGETVIQFLSCASALESLTCWSYGYISRSLSKVLPNDVVPKLQEFRGCALYGPVLTPGRPIRHLALGEMKTHRHLPGLRIGSIAPNFGSSVPLESLIINHLDRDLKNYLAEILLKCPLIHELAVTTHTGNEWGVDAEGFVAEHLSILVQFTNLRKITIPYFSHVPTTRALDWERSVCQRLKRANPYLAYVSFSSILAWRSYTMEDRWVPEGLGTVAHHHLETSKNLSHVQPTHWPEVHIPGR